MNIISHIHSMIIHNVILMTYIPYYPMLLSNGKGQNSSPFPSQEVDGKSPAPSWEGLCRLLSVWRCEKTHWMAQTSFSHGLVDFLEELEETPLTGLFDRWYTKPALYQTDIIAGWVIQFRIGQFSSVMAGNTNDKLGNNWLFLWFMHSINGALLILITYNW